MQRYSDSRRDRLPSPPLSLVEYYGLFASRPSSFSEEVATMEWMSRSDVVLLGIAAYVAVMTLVRLMKQRRDVLVADVERQIKAHRHTMKRQRKARENKEENRDAA